MTFYKSVTCGDAERRSLELWAPPGEHLPTSSSRILQEDPSQQDHTLAMYYTSSDEKWLSGGIATSSPSSEIRYSITAVPVALASASAGRDPPDVLDQA
jgi:hypothetical protein